MAFILDTPINGMTAAQFAALSPSEKLSHSAKMPNKSPGAPAAIQCLAHAQIHTPRSINCTMKGQIRAARRQDLLKSSLNSWMAFRSFYSGMFTNLQQKEAVACLTTLWKQDPFKAKWNIIARAFSSIRGVVGKPNAPLDWFLNIVTPQVGVLGIAVYFDLMNWTTEITDDGATILHQSANPDLSTFPAKIMRTSMTEKDVIHFCAKKRYITVEVARRIAGPHADDRMIYVPNKNPQNGLLASAPVLPAPAGFAQITNNPARADQIPKRPLRRFIELATNNPARQQGLLPTLQPSAPSQESEFWAQTTRRFVELATNNPARAASQVLGFDVNQLLGASSTSQPSSSAAVESVVPSYPYPWTGSMADLYNPAEGSLDFANNTKQGGASLWDTTNIHDAAALENMIEVGGVQDGYLAPFVPDDETENYLG